MKIAGKKSPDIEMCPNERNLAIQVPRRIKSVLEKQVYWCRWTGLAKGQPQLAQRGQSFYPRRPETLLLCTETPEQVGRTGKRSPDGASGPCWEHSLSLKARDSPTPPSDTETPRGHRTHLEA